MMDLLYKWSFYLHITSPRCSVHNFLWSLVKWCLFSYGNRETYSRRHTEERKRNYSILWPEDNIYTISCKIEYRLSDADCIWQSGQPTSPQPNCLAAHHHYILNISGTSLTGGLNHALKYRQFVPAFYGHVIRPPAALMSFVSATGEQNRRLTLCLCTSGE